ncbi:MAG: glycosyltransferase family 4 protein [bacterium]|jgi:glycosyltransferase involved in cell wall biosynthesis|nr:glycosyltransferase family 4 protein [bacterium]MBK9775964.1 glycosyltransferase family 4 protein [bacterium]
MPLTILTACTSRAWGGMEMSLVQTSVRLRARGHAVVPLCAPGSPIEERLRAEGFVPETADLWGKVHPRQAWRLSRLIGRRKIDLVHCDWSRDLFTLVPALALHRRVPLVLHKHVGVLAGKRLWVHYALYRRVDHVIAISDVIHGNFIAMHPIDPRKVVTIHNGIDPGRFRPDPATRARLRAELGYADDDLVVGIVGRVTPSKGHREFLGMAARLAVTHPRARFLVVGEATRGEEDEGRAILDGIATAGLAERVKVTGFRPDVPDLLAAMDVFAFPSHNEAFGLALIEAMATGLPTVSADCDGVLDIVEEGNTGLMVPPRDGERLALATARLLDDDGLRARMGAAGRARVLAHFTAERMAQDLERLYADAVARRGGPVSGGR